VLLDVPALSATAHPVEDPELPQPLQRRGDGAHANAGLGSNGGIARIQASYIGLFSDTNILSGEIRTMSRMLALLLE
jgi:hypothetical protein